MRADVKPGTSFGDGGYKSAQCAVPSIKKTSLLGMGGVNGWMMPSACQGSTFPLEKKVFEVTIPLPPKASSLRENISVCQWRGNRGTLHPFGVWSQRHSKSILARSQEVIEGDAFAERLLFELSSLKVTVFSASLIRPASSRAGRL